MRPLEPDYWAAPLEDQIAAVLAEEIGAVTGLRPVARYPWPAGRRPDRRVEVEILRFDTDTTGVVDLRARWKIQSATAVPAVLASGEAVALEGADGTAVADRVEAMSRALTRLAREITAQLR